MELERGALELRGAPGADTNPELRGRVQLQRALTAAPGAEDVLAAVAVAEDEDFDPPTAARALSWLAKLRVAEGSGGAGAGAGGAAGSPAGQRRRRAPGSAARRPPGGAAYARLQAVVAANLGGMAPAELCAVAVANDRLFERPSYGPRLAKRLNATLLRPEVDAALSPDTLALVLLAMVRLKWKASPQLAGLVARRSAEGTSPTLSRMDPEELSQLAWSFARLRFQPGPDWQMAFEEHALRCAFRFNLLHISKTFFAFSRFRDPMAPDLWLALQRRARALAVRGSDLVASVFTNMVKTRLRADPVLVKELAGLLARDLEAVCRSRDTMAASNFLWALTQVPRGADLAAEQWAQIDGAFEGTGVLESMRDQELCISLWAFARLGQLPSPGLLRQFEACVLDRVGSLSATDLVTVVHAYATLEHAPSPELLEALERGVGRQTRKLSPRQVANVLWGWAKLGHQPRRQALESLSARALETLGKFSGQNLSNTLWAFASLERLPGEAFLEAFDAAAARELTRASPQAHANIMWSYARLGVRPSAELMDLSDEIMTVKIRAYSPLNIAHVVWAYAKLNHCPDIPLLEACEEAIGSKFRQFNARDFSNTLWGLRKMEYRLSFRLLQEIEGAFLDTLDRGGATDQDIALVMWAYARSDFSLAQASVDRLVAAATEKLAARFDLKSFTHIFFATGRMGRACDDFYFRFEAERLDAVPSVDLETAIKLLYSCSLHGICPSDHALGICEAAILEGLPEMDYRRLAGIQKSYADLELPPDRDLPRRVEDRLAALYAGGGGGGGKSLGGGLGTGDWRGAAAGVSLQERDDALVSVDCA